MPPGRLVSAFAAVVALALAVAPLALSAPAKQPARSTEGQATLLVKVAGLPAGTKADVFVRGAGVRRAITKTSRLRVKAPARVAIAVRPVTVKGGARYAIRPTVRVAIPRRGGLVRATVRYRVFVPSTTEVLSARAAGAITEVSDDAIVLPASRARDLGVGDVLVSGPSAAAPDGLLRAITARRTEGRSAVLTTREATLPEALPEASFSVRIDEQGEIATGGDIVAAPVGGPAKRAMARLSLEKTLSLNHDIAARGCSVGGSVLRTEGELSVGAEAELNASWRPFRSPEASFQATLKTNGEIKLVSGLHAGCRVEFETPKVRLGTIAFAIGPVPVVIVPTLSGVVKASVEGGVDGTFGARLFTRASAGLSVRDGKVSPWKDADQGLEAITPNFADSISGTAKASGGPRLTLAFYGAGGPTASALGTATGRVAPADDPWWTLDGGFEARLGGSFDVLGVKASADIPIVERTWRLADAGGPLRRGGGTQGGGGTAPGGGANEGGGATGGDGGSTTPGDSGDGTTPDTQRRFVNLDDRLPMEVTVENFAVAYSDSARLYLVGRAATTRGIAPVFRSDNAGGTWIRMNPDDLDNTQTQLRVAPRQVVVGPSSPDEVYVVSENEVLVSGDGGHSWRPDPASSSLLRPLDLQITPSGTFYILDSGGIHRRTSSAESWTPISLPPPPYEDLHCLQDLKVADDDRTLYVTDCDTLYRTDDGGANWLRVLSPDDIDPPVGEYQFLALDWMNPLHPRQIAVGLEGEYDIPGGGEVGDVLGAYESTDGGATWTPYAQKISPLARDVFRRDPLLEIGSGAGGALVTLRGGEVSPLDPTAETSGRLWWLWVGDDPAEHGYALFFEQPTESRPAPASAFHLYRFSARAARCEGLVACA